MYDHFFFFKKILSERERKRQYKKGHLLEHTGFGIIEGYQFQPWWREYLEQKRQTEAYRPAQNYATRSEAAAT